MSNRTDAHDPSGPSGHLPNFVGEGMIPGRTHMDTFSAKPSGTRKVRPAIVEALLAEVVALDVASVQERMLPAGCYTEPEFFAFEQAEVFGRSWI